MGIGGDDRPPLSNHCSAECIPVVAVWTTAVPHPSSRGGKKIMTGLVRGLWSYVKSYVSHNYVNHLVPNAHSTLNNYPEHLQLSSLKFWTVPRARPHVASHHCIVALLQSTSCVRPRARQHRSIGLNVIIRYVDDKIYICNCK